jgi:pimeloyl-ACP methyl ester carboxylesterase
MEAPDVRYAKSDDVSIAYAIVGDGPFDLVFGIGWFLSALENSWDGPPAEFYMGLASFCRLILFDKRGTGLSDRDAGLASLPARTDDIRSVMDAAGSRQAAIMGVSEAGPMTMLFASTYPERTVAAILYGTGATNIKADDYPWGDTREAFEEWLRDSHPKVGTSEWLDEALTWYAPSLLEDENAKRWWRRWARTSASPASIEALYRMNMEVDVRAILPSIHVPTLVLHRLGDQGYYIDEGRYLAERIPDAQLIEMPGDDHAWFVDPEPVVREVKRFLGSVWGRDERDAHDPARALATVLFTDIVGSTDRLAELGDREWRTLLDQHHGVIRRELVRYSGREVDTAGDGFFATFDGPARGVHCAQEIIEAMRPLGLQIRAGLHTGEVEKTQGKVGGLAVHIGARVGALAGPSEVLVSQTVKDLVAGSGLVFEDAGEHELKGVPDHWHLYRVVS